MQADRQNYSIRELPKGRRTVVDLLLVIGKDAVPGYMTMDIDMKWATDLLSRYKYEGHKATITAVLLKAIGVAQQHHPLSRTEVATKRKLVTYNDIVGGITVEREVEGQPTVFFAEIDSPHTKSIPEIADILRDLSDVGTEEWPPFAMQASFSRLPGFVRELILRVGRCFPLFRLKCQRATFGVTSLGKYGVSSLFTPCICTSTLGIGEIEDRLVVHKGKVKIRPMMTISYNFDQRILDSSTAARFLREIRTLLEGRLQNWIEREGEPERDERLSQAA